MERAEVPVSTHFYLRIGLNASELCNARATFQPAIQKHSSWQLYFDCTAPTEVVVVSFFPYFFFFFLNVKRTSSHLVLKIPLSAGCENETMRWNASEMQYVSISSVSQNMPSLQPLCLRIAQSLISSCDNRACFLTDPALAVSHRRKRCILDFKWRKKGLGGGGGWGINRFIPSCKVT